MFSSSTTFLKTISVFSWSRCRLNMIHHLVQAGWIKKQAVLKGCSNTSIHLFTDGLNYRHKETTVPLHALCVFQCFDLLVEPDDQRAMMLSCRMSTQPCGVVEPPPCSLITPGKYILEMTSLLVYLVVVLLEKKKNLFWPKTQCWKRIQDKSTRSEESCVVLFPWMASLFGLPVMWRHPPLKAETTSSTADENVAVRNRTEVQNSCKVYLFCSICSMAGGYFDLLFY